MELSSANSQPGDDDERHELLESSRFARRLAVLVVGSVASVVLLLVLPLSQAFHALAPGRELVGVTVGGTLVLLVFTWIGLRSYVMPVLERRRATLNRWRATARAAQLSVETQSKFLTSMSHEIRTPIHSLLGTIELVLDSSLSPAQEQKIRTIHASLRALLRVVSDIQDLSKLEADRYDLLPERCSLHALLQSSLDLLAPAARDKGLTLELQMLTHVPDTVQLDVGSVQQVLLNLIHNAIESTESGGVKIQAEAINTTSQRFDLRVRVEDTGSAVPKAERDALFDAFNQPKRSLTRGPRGTGLGLCISKKLVTLLKGEIARLDGDGPGNIFQFVIPVVRLAELLTHPSAPISGQPYVMPVCLPSPTAPILIVDDDELHQLVAIELLEDLGFDVEVAAGAEEAITLASTRKYALILMDCQMPESDGHAAARRIRALETPQNRVPIIACTAQPLLDDRTKLLAAGMDDQLKKPLERDSLCRILAAWLPDEKHPISSGTRLTEAARKRASARPLSNRDGTTPDLLPRRRSERLVDLFVTQVPEELRWLALAVDAGHTDEVVERAQKLKASSEGCGAMKMVALCASLEGARNLSANELSAKVKDLNEAFALVLGLLGEQRPQSGTATAPSSGERNPEAP